MRLVLKQTGYTTFTGRLGTQTFTNGMSDHDLTEEQGMQIAALMEVDWVMYAPAWLMNTPYALNAEITGSDGNIWKCTTAGTSGATQPAWPASPTVSTTQVDNTATWTYVQKADTGVDDVTDSKVNQLTDEPTQTIPQMM